MGQLVDGVIIIGASGHARMCMDILKVRQKLIWGFCDDDKNLSTSALHGYQIFGGIELAVRLINEKEADYFVAIGNNDDRRQVANMMMEHCQRPPINVVHPSAVISPHITMGHGNFIAPGAIINIDTALGNYTIINTAASLDHDNHIHDFAQVSPGCHLAGHVTIEEGAFLGTGAIVIPGKTIGAYAIIGAGAVIINDIPPSCTAVGIPGRVIKTNECSA
jgi:acetyltransferase EpsM